MGDLIERGGGGIEKNNLTLKNLTLSLLSPNVINYCELWPFRIREANLPILAM